MNYLNNTISIGEVVAFNPLATGIFKEYGIDYCCGGHRPLLEVVNSQGIDKEALYNELQEADTKRREQYINHGNHFSEMSPVTLSAYIEDTHHSYLRKYYRKHWSYSILLCVFMERTIVNYLRCISCSEV